MFHATYKGFRINEVRMGGHGLELTAVILAAGYGKRMKSRLVKVMHPVGGKPMVGHIVSAARAAGAGRIIVVVGHGAEQVRSYLGDTVEYALQAEQLGTGHALMQAEGLVAGATGNLLVLNGDCPLMSSETLKSLVSEHVSHGQAATVLAAVAPDPTGLGRILRAPDGTLARIVEHKDATEAERAIREINAGIYCFRLQGITDRQGQPHTLFELLRTLKQANAQGEYYLTDIVATLADLGQRVAVATTDDAESVLGINDRRQLAQAEAALRQRILEHWMDEGVTILDPQTTYIDADVHIGKDTTVYPFTFVRGATTIGEGCSIGPHTSVLACRVGDGVHIEQSVVEESTIGDGCRIGPYAHLRPNCVLGKDVEVGNYAELKKTRLGDGSKCHHHSYLGDAVVGANANIGAGVITCNYDGVAKHVTHIGDSAFIGTNVNLVAPISVGNNGYVAAGSTVTRDVPADALAISRSPQENKEGRARVLIDRARRRKQQAQPGQQQ